MASPQPILTLHPFSPAQIGRDSVEMPRIPDETVQLGTDVINVFEGRVPLSSFDPDYQIKIKNFYRFSATRYTSNMPKPIRKIRDTIEII